MGFNFFFQIKIHYIYYIGKCDQEWLFFFFIVKKIAYLPRSEAGVKLIKLLHFSPKNNNFKRTFCIILYSAMT